jgi:hypothetical protein
MVAIKGYYDGSHFVALENVPIRKNNKVIITFLDEEVDVLPNLSVYIEPMLAYTDINAIAEAQGYRGIETLFFDDVIAAMDIQEPFEQLLADL